MTEQERFEQHIHNINCDAEIVLRKEADGSYRNPTTKLLWEIWQAATVQVPEGYVVVPVEPTGAMIDSALHQMPRNCDITYNDVYRAYNDIIQTAQENQQ